MGLISVLASYRPWEMMGPGLFVSICRQASILTPGTRCGFAMKRRGRGGFVQSADFQDVANDMGPVVDYVPSGDGVRVDQIRVVGTDVDGNETVAFVPVSIPNLPPSFRNLNYSQRVAPPVILAPQGEQQWPIELAWTGSV